MDIKVETQIKLDKFKPRPFQIPILDAIENKNYKRVIAIWPRRAGKDITAWNLCIRQCLKKVCVIYYIFPTYSQAKKVIWDSVTNDGKRILDYIPEELIQSKNGQEMKIRFINGSLLQLVGSDNYDALMGTNPQGCVFSEYALQDPRAYGYIRPILMANDGWALFISTPRGKNSLWELYNIALNSDQWFAHKLTVLDTGHISMHDIERERAEGLMSEDLIQQEYFTSFELGVEGAYYSKYIDNMKLRGQIGQVPWEVGFKVHTAWDLGVRDSTVIIFFQTIGQTVRVIDYYENSKQGLEFYIKILEGKSYSYGKHFAPHDIKVREFTSGMSRIEKAKQLGVNFTVAPDLSIMDGIEAVRSAFSKIWIDEVKCKDLIRALEGYRQEFDIKRKVYKNCPLHDHNSHACFSGDTRVLTRSGMRPIMNIRKNTQVLTLSGWKKCLKAKKTKKNASIVEVMFQDGTIVKCTPDHLFLTENGWKSAKYLQPNTEIRSSLTSLLNILTGAYTEYGQMKDIILEAALNCTEMPGDSLLVKYLQTVMSITEITRQIITICGISNASLKKIILANLALIIKDLRRLLSIKQPNGIVRRLEDFGIVGTLEQVLLGLNGTESLGYVCTAKKNLTVLLEKMETNKSFVIPTVKPPVIEKVNLLDEKIDVWDITVPGEGNFSLENCAVVHNSDGFRYLCLSLPKTRDGASPEDLDKRYNEVYYGMSKPGGFFSDGPTNY
jgi:hypothetical protein